MNIDEELDIYTALQYQYATHQARISKLVSDRDLREKQQMFLRESRLSFEYHTVIPTNPRSPFHKILTGKRYRPTLRTTADYEIESVSLGNWGSKSVQSFAKVNYLDPQDDVVKSEKIIVPVRTIKDLTISMYSLEMQSIFHSAIEKFSNMLAGKAPETGEVTGSTPLLVKVIDRPQELPGDRGVRLLVSDSFIVGMLESFLINKDKEMYEKIVNVVLKALYPDDYRDIKKSIMDVYNNGKKNILRLKENGSN